ncbi:MFS transporter asaE like protein [Verticillium longisporum]|nr:MFS transporter asaE like protein [Verticillium longisporum]
MFAPSAFVAPLKDYTEGQIGWIFSTFVFLCFFCGIYIGPLFDKYGPRWLIFSGSVCVVTAMMLLSVCTEYWHFLLTFGFLNGIGASLLFTPAYSAVGHWFSERRGLATGVASTGASFAGMISPVLPRVLFERVGWAWAIRTIAFICLLFCAVATPLIQSRLAPKPDAKARPDVRIFRDPAFSLTTISIFFLEFALFIPLTYISSYSLRQGFGTSFSYQIPTILNAVSVAGRVLAGWWGDHFGPFNSNILAAVLNPIACLAIWLPAGSSMPGIVMFSVVFGFGSGNNISISPVCIGRLCETSEYGRYYATAFTSLPWPAWWAFPLEVRLSEQQGEITGVSLCSPACCTRAVSQHCVLRGWCVSDGLSRSDSRHASIWGEQALFLYRFRGLGQMLIRVSNYPYLTSPVPSRNQSSAASASSVEA